MRNVDVDGTRGEGVPIRMMGGLSMVLVRLAIFTCAIWPGITWTIVAGGMVGLAVVVKEGAALHTIAQIMLPSRLCRDHSEVQLQYIC